MNAPNTPTIGPADVRVLRRLSLEVRLCLDTARTNPQRYGPFVDDAFRHLGLLRELVRCFAGSCRVAALGDLSKRAHLALLTARSRRHCWKSRPFVYCWKFRMGFVTDATRCLLAFEHKARALEAVLWED